MNAPRATPGQLRALVEAAQWAGMAAEQLAALVTAISDVTTAEALTVDDFADVMDVFVVGGFRHRLAPMVTPVQLTALDEARRAAGLDARTFVRGLHDVLGVRSRRQLDGLGFAYAMEWLARLGSRVPLPGHGYMTRARVGTLHEAAYRVRMDGATFREHLVRLGGVLRASHLDRRGFQRVLMTVTSPGLPNLPARPTVPSDPGMVTQGQANLLWRLWLDVDG